MVKNLHMNMFKLIVWGMLILSQFLHCSALAVKSQQIKTQEINYYVTVLLYSLC